MILVRVRALVDAIESWCRGEPERRTLALAAVCDLLANADDSNWRERFDALCALLPRCYECATPAIYYFDDGYADGFRCEAHGTPCGPDCCGVCWLQYGEEMLACLRLVRRNPRSVGVLHANPAEP